MTNVTERDGRRLVTLSASIDRVAGDGVDDTTATLRVDESCVIRDAETEVSYGGGNVYRTAYRVVQLGDVTPERPAWVDAVPPSAALQVGLDVSEFDATSIQLVRTYGDAVPAGSTVTVVSNGTRYETTLTDEFGDGERHLWIDSNSRLRVTQARPSSADVRTLGQEVTVTVRAPDGGELFSTSIGRQPGEKALVVRPGIGNAWERLGTSRADGVTRGNALNSSSMSAGWTIPGPSTPA